MWSPSTISLLQCSSSTLKSAGEVRGFVPFALLKREFSTAYFYCKDFSNFQPKFIHGECLLSVPVLPLGESFIRGGSCLVNSSVYSQIHWTDTEGTSLQLSLPSPHFLSPFLPVSYRFQRVVISIFSNHQIAHFLWFYILNHGALQEAVIPPWKNCPDSRFREPAVPNQ